MEIKINEPWITDKVRIQNGYAYIDHPFWNAEKQQADHKREYIGKYDGKDFKPAFEYVAHTKTGKFTNVDLGKRRLNLNSKAIEVLKEQRKVNPFGEYIFVSKNGTALLTNRINEHLKGFCKKPE